MKDKKKLRRLTYLCGEIGFSFEHIKFSIDREFTRVEEFYKPRQTSRYTTHFKDYHELLSIFKDLNYTDDEAFKFWYQTYKNRRMLRNIYRKKPIPVRKDNPNTYGEKFVGGGTRRMPRKCRKTAWKRFYKIFPDLKGLI